MKEKFFHYTLLILLILSMTYVLINPLYTAYHVQAGIKLCVQSVLPSLFIFMVFSRLLAHISARHTNYGKASLFLSKILNLPPNLIPICLSGLFCSAPSGAFAVCSLCDNGLCTKDEAERASIISDNCSMAFILGFVSAIIGCKTAAIYIAISNILSSITVYMLFFRGKYVNFSPQQNLNDKIEPISQIITDSICSAATSCITLCGYIIFFYTLSSTICDNVFSIFGQFSFTTEHVLILKAVTASFFEISSGTTFTGLLSAPESYVLCSAAVAFTGMSMILQVTSLLNRHGIPSRKYFLSKVLCAALSPVLMTAIMLLSPVTVSVSSSNGNLSYSGVTVQDVFSLIIITAISLSGARLLYYLDKKHKK